MGVISQPDRIFATTGESLDYNLGPWNSEQEYVNWRNSISITGKAAIKSGTHIQVYETVGGIKTGRVIEKVYQRSTQINASPTWEIIAVGEVKTNLATQIADGLMSKTDKERLDTLWENGVLASDITDAPSADGGSTGSGTGGGAGQLTSDELGFLRSMMTNNVLKRLSSMESQLQGISFVKED